MIIYKHTLAIFSVLLFPLSVWAQYDYMDIPLQKNGSQSTVAWAGGLNTPQFSVIDLNNDGTDDLVVYDRSGRITLTFLNNGTPNQVDYTYAPEYQDRFPQANDNFVLLRDFNNDNIKDIFFFARPDNFLSGSIAAMTGGYDSNNKIMFSPYDSAIHYISPNQSNNLLAILNSDLPAIDDIDNDGDMDFLAFPIDFLYTRNISWFKNMSVEDGAGGNTLKFEQHHQCWGMVTETNMDNTVYLSPDIDSCPDNAFWVPPAVSGPRHAGSTLAAIDWNGDGHKDMVMGDMGINSLNMMTTTIINDSFLVTTQDATYPNYNTSADIFSFPAAFFLDVNNDGITDMLASPNDNSYQAAITDSVVWYYQNTQSNTNVQLDFQQKDFLVGDMIDLGEDATPLFFDYNADGLLDILIGHYGYLRTDSTIETGLTLLENTGTATAPSFTYITNDYGNLSTLNAVGMHPTAGDLDGDGDQDLLLGLADGTLTYLENTAGSGNTATWATAIPNYNNIDIDDNAAPQLIDLDRDGDLDLVVGEYNGNINYFENTGNSSSPTFSSTPTTIGLSGVDVRVLTPSSRRASPCIFEVDGHYEMFIGHQTGYPLHLNQVEDDIMGTYNIVDEKVEDLWTGGYSDLDVADINNDGRLDVVIGNKRGGISFFGIDTNTVATHYIPTTEIDYLFPNPTPSVLHIQLQKENTQDLHFTIVNALGQVVLEKTTTQVSAQHHLSIADLPNGLYFLAINGQNGQAFRVQH